MENCIKAISFFLVFIAIILTFICISNSNKNKNEIATITTSFDTLTTSEAIPKFTSQVKENSTKIPTELKSKKNVITTTKSTTAKSTKALTTELHTSKIASKEQLKYLGKFDLTAYCPCAKCCGSYANGYTATGTIAKPNHTIAVDPTVIPYGSHVIIDGQEYVAEDCGGGIKKDKIDIFFATHQEACNFGVHSADVYLVVD